MKKLVILHHTGDLSEALKAFLKKQDVTWMKPEEYPGELTPTHLFTDGRQDFTALSELYNTLEDDVRIVALGAVADPGLFTAANGKLVFDPMWAGDPMGQMILEKFFIGQASVHLDENFPAMKEHGGFKITNHLRIGHDMDRLAQFAHARETSLVDLRTFVDHAIYYFCYLQQGGIASAPFELDYGHTGQGLVVQIHLPVRQFVAEYLMDSFGKYSPGEPLRHLLRVCAEATDFMEIHYIENAAKLVVTGYWESRSGKRSLRFNGLMINQVHTTAQLARMLEEALAQPLGELEPEGEAEFENVQEIAHKPLPGKIRDLDEVAPPSDGYLADKPELTKNLVTYATEQFQETHPDDPPELMDTNALMEILAGHPEADQVNNLGQSDLEHILQSMQKVLGKATEDDFAQIIGGSAEEDPFSQTVTGGEEEDPFSQKVAGEVEEEDRSKQVIKGKKTEQDKTVTRLAASAEPEKGAWNVHVGAGGEASSGSGTQPGLAAGGASALVLDKLKQLNSENIRNKDLLEKTRSELRAIKDVQKQMEDINAQASKIVISDETEESETMNFLNELSSGKAIDPAKLQKFAETVKMAENEVRKGKLELMQKDLLFQQELEKAQRQIKARDLVVEKAKESLRLIGEKKDKEITDLNTRLNAFSAQQAAAQTMSNQLKTLEQEKQSMMRLVETYKTKMASLGAAMEKKNTNTGGKSDEEFRHLQMDKQRAEVALKAAQKDIEKLRSRGDLAQDELKRVALEKTEIELELKKTLSTLAANTAKVAGANNANDQQLKEAERELQAQTLKAQRADQQVKELEGKVADMTGMLAKNSSNNGSDQALKKRATQLEASVKKMSQDLASAMNATAETKKEVNKLQSEKMGLQNQLDKTKRDLDKALKALSEISKKAS